MTKYLYLKYKDSNADLERQYRLAGISSGKAMLRKSKVNNQIYLFLKTDNSERGTLDCILEMERLLRENESELKGRRLYFDKIQTDKFDFARNVLNTTELTCNYYTTLFLFL